MLRNFERNFGIKADSSRKGNVKVALVEGAWLKSWGCRLPNYREPTKSGLVQSFIYGPFFNLHTNRENHNYWTF